MAVKVLKEAKPGQSFADEAAKLVYLADQVNAYKEDSESLSDVVKRAKVVADLAENGYTHKATLAALEHEANKAISDVEMCLRSIEHIRDIARELLAEVIA